MLQRLIDGKDNPYHTALVEEPPPSGFVGESPDGRRGNVVFTRNDSEHLSLRVAAPRRGFVVLADQWFPGWRATVNGQPVAIMRGNYLFRVVEVPGGISTVEFVYAPDSLRFGALISIATATALAYALVRSRRRRRASA